MAVMSTRRARPGLLAAVVLGALVAVPWPVAAAEVPSAEIPLSSPASETAPPDPTPAPTPTPGPSQPAPTATPSASATPTAVPTPTPPLAPTPVPTPTSTTPAPTPVPTPSASPAPTPAPTPVPSDFLLYRRSAIVRQYTDYWCVPATTQTMLNLIRGTSDRSIATQHRYYRGIRRHNRYTYRTRGNDPQGWAWGLRRYSGWTTTYTARSFTSKSRAMWAIHDSIARTGQPVGITVYHGTHAWIVLGYRSVHDPLDPTRRTLLGFYVSGPLRGSRDPWPYRYIRLADFRKVFGKYHERQRRVIWEDKWVIISQ